MSVILINRHPTPILTVADCRRVKDLFTFGSDGHKNRLLYPPTYTRLYISQ